MKDEKQDVMQAVGYVGRESEYYDSMSVHKEANLITLKMQSAHGRVMIVLSQEQADKFAKLIESNNKEVE